MPPLKKIVVTGPESTGKSTLSGQLALKYQTQWVPEFAREYLTALGRPYTYDDLLIIARGQIAMEDRITANLKSPLVFMDTDLYVIKVWCEYVFGKCHPFILDEIVKRKYDAYLLCNTDLPWVADTLREYPDHKTRYQLYHIYKDLLINQHTPWFDISGGYEERLQKAIQYVDRLS
ncbi:MAG TPA: ATPase [Chitinophagaceae bacterium]|jgi:NadR type nicotinamide-nucleotide adenylyltransferase|nr:ATPase [Chitinophagaceae bacterium]